MKRRSDPAPHRSWLDRRLAAGLLGAWGSYQVVAGLYFIFSRPSFLPEDLRASATTLEAVRGAAPGIEGWLQLVFAVMGGQMAAGGVLVMSGAFSLAQGRRPKRVELCAYIAAGFLSVVLMSGVNFALVSDFRWFLVAPAFLWLSAIIILGRGALGNASRVASVLVRPNQGMPHE